MSALIQAAPLAGWATACLRTMGMPDEDAQLLADSLVQTSLWGVDSHGIARLTHYLERLSRGSIKTRPRITITRSGPCTAQLHADQGQGIVVAHRAMAEAVALARDAGVGAVGVTDSSHCGALALYTRPVARQGLVALAFTHSDKMAAPQGGPRAFLGTNPISIALPRAGGPELCLDMATTAIPWNRVMNARRTGAALPPDAALDAAGQTTRDAEAARALRPLGGADYGHKGYGLAMMVDLLCGPLHANPIGPELSDMFHALDAPRRLGAFFMVLDPARFAGGPLLAEGVARMAQALAQEPGSPLLPGDPELRCEAQRRRDGIPVDATLLAQWQDWSARLALAPPLSAGPG